MSESVLKTLALAPAHEQARALAAGEVSAVQLLQQVLARVDHYNPRINAVIARDDAAARAAAEAADAALARGERKPLLGVPVSLKENFHVAGYVTSVGDPAWANNLATADAPAVAALRDAGAVVIGKTNVPLALADLQSYNAVYGTSHNPWDLARTPGGSSGGSAAALAAGFSALDLGTDIGGSVRIPAHFTGVFSHKSSFGLVYNGSLGVPPGKLSLRDLGVIGPLARSAHDLALVLPLLLNRDPVASTTWRAQLPPARQQRLSDFRVLLVPHWPGQEASLSEQLVVQRLQAALREQGVQIVHEADLPAGVWPNLSQAHVLYRSLLASSLPAQVASTQTPGPSVSDADAAWRNGPYLTHSEWLVQHEARLQLRQQWAQVFEHVDVVLTPVLATPAFAHNHSEPKDQRTFPVRYAEGERAVRFLDLFHWAGLPVLPGLPATSFPLGLDGDGLPISAQAVGSFLEDLTPIRFAQLLEDAGISQYQTPPGFGALS